MEPEGALLAVPRLVEVKRIEASPDGWHEHDRFTLEPKAPLRKPSGGSGRIPVVSNSRLHLSDQELIFSSDIKSKK